MSNRYLVKCPQFGCNWSGLLGARRSADAWFGFDPNGAIVAFHCPRCEQSWKARTIGEKVKLVCTTHAEAELAPTVWPPVEIGVGD